MSLGHLPSIVTNGLVLYYDMNNTKKSWKGAPTVNLFGSLTDYAGGLAAGYWSIVDSSINSFKLSSTYNSWCSYRIDDIC